MIDLFLGDNQVKLLLTNEKHKVEDLDDTDASLVNPFCEGPNEFKRTSRFYSKRDMTIGP